jgi:hypothetical protein
MHEKQEIFAGTMYNEGQTIEKLPKQNYLKNFNEVGLIVK